MEHGRRVLVFPDWPGNAYLNLLALAPRAQGFEFVGADTVGQLIRILATLRERDLLHVHWTSPIAQDATNLRQATSAVRRLDRQLHRARRRGVRVIWTIHNRLPHELQFREPEAALYRVLADQADVIHVMSRATVQALADIVTLPPDKVWLLPHPTYSGLYDTTLDRSAARRELHLAEDRRAVLLFGQIRPYKGTRQAIAAVAAAAEVDPRITLLIAGRCVEAEKQEVIDAIPGHLDHRLHLQHIEEPDVALWFRASDVALFPFTSILNSGSAHLAATFGVAMLLPDEPPLVEVFRSYAGANFYSQNDSHSLENAINAAVTLEDTSPAEPSWGTSPWEVSRLYAAKLDELSRVTGLSGPMNSAA
ncbi:glycosyltransferase [Microbacterium aurantiacum]|uniref:glycosyltransferase n=1 Tax=Microbacterium aurantiacum TaxID=162393 RepID=UPI000A6CBDC5|nr:glycosyltransferase [Microbacterium chocolatum]